ncbi:MAG: hypothetical protein GXY47_13360 [Acidobacteria bacterium]|nr:hypothetical protein [Acidobacteriota bacterium]
MNIRDPELSGFDSLDFYNRWGRWPEKGEALTAVPWEHRADLAKIRRAPVGCLYGYVATWHTAALDREIQIAPCAFSAWLERDVDCAVLLDHDSEQLIGRKSDGALFLAEDRRGLYFEYRLPDSSRGDRIKRAFELNRVLGVSFRPIVRQKDFSAGIETYRRLDLAEISILTSDRSGASPGAWARFNAGHKGAVYL